MSQAFAIGPETRISELLEQRPELRPALQSQGIDLCCGGSLTLTQAAELRGIPVADLLAALGAAPPPGQAALVGGKDSLRGVLAAHPGTGEVFARHGLLGCGGADGPDERIDFFAAAHRVDLAVLLRELNEAAARKPEPAAVPVQLRPPPPPERPLFVPFLRAALLSTATLGASFGAYNLLVIHWVLGEHPPSHNWVHAGFQIWGFVLLFIMGISTHTVPRFLGQALAYPGAVRQAWWITILAQLLIGWGRLGELLPGTVPAAALGPVLQIAAVLIWGAALFRTWRRSGATLELFHVFLAVGTLSWLAAAGALVGGGVEAVLEGDAEAAVRWNQAVYALALFGGTMGWIQGFLLRVGPVFLGLRAPSRPWLLLSLGTGPLGAALLAAGSLRVRHPEGLPLMDAGLLGIGLSLLSYVLGFRPFSRPASEAAGEHGIFRKGVRGAWAFALLFAGLAGIYGVRSLAGFSAPGLLLDGARHAFTVGFVSLLILSFAGRVVPVFTGADLHRPRLWAWSLALLAAGVLLREAQVLAPVFRSQVPLYVSGLSGMVAAAGIGGAAWSIWGTLRGRRDARRPAAAPGVISADDKIAGLLEAHPEALPILIQAGFTPLANPVMRRMMGGMVTLRQACGMHGIGLPELLQRLQEACPHGRAAAPPPPPKPAASAGPPPTREELMDVLRGVRDPELGANIVDVGLVYEITPRAGGDVEIRMTLTDPACPHAAVLLEQVRRAVGSRPGVRHVEVALVFEPRWTPERMTEALRVKLGVA